MVHRFTRTLLSVSVLLLATLGCRDARPHSFADGGGVPGDAGMTAHDSGAPLPHDAGGGDGALADARRPGDGAGRGEACGDGCAEGLECVTDGTISLCVGVCDATEYTGCLRTESCNIPLDATRSACSPSCDLLTADGCPSTMTCGVFADATGAVYKDCDSAGTRTQGEDCDSSSKCAPGHVCAYWSSPPYASGWECLQFCDLSGADGPACPAGTTCSSPPNEAEPFATIDGLGVCR
jgi:hypothetical protein